MSFNDNKYRIRISSKVHRGPWKGFTRLEAIKTLAGKRDGNEIYGKVDFHQRRIDGEHREALVEIAKLWRKLDEYEKAVKER